MLPDTQESTTLGAIYRGIGGVISHPGPQRAIMRSIPTVSKGINYGTRPRRS
jgi:hypothetical protein